MDLSTTISPANMIDWVYDAQRDQIYFIGSDRSFYTWSVAEQRFTAPQTTLGFTPNDIEISADGTYLLISNGARVVTSGPFAFETTYANDIQRWNLVTGEIDVLRFVPNDFGEGAIGDIAVGADNTLLVSTNYLGSGWTPLRRAQSDAAAPAFERVTSGLQFGELTGGAFIESEDKRYILVHETNISSGPLHVYDTVTDSVIASSSLSNIPGIGSGFQTGKGDISTAAGMVLDVVYNNVFVTDLALNPLANLSSYQSAGRVVGGEFNDGGRQLFLWQGQESRILVLDTATWQQVGTITVGSATLHGYNGAPFGYMDVASNGRMLILDHGAKLELIDLAERLKITIAGDATNQALHGAIGTDSLTGGGGADTLMGYAGADSLGGDAGDDSVAGGEGSNYLRGGEGHDSLTGGGAFDDMHGNQGDDRLWGGEGDDWVVGGQDSDVLFGEAGSDVVLGNLGSDTLEGGDGDDVVRGGQADDAIRGGAGIDWISGDRGFDSLTGGAGADNFHVFDGSGVDWVFDFSASEGDRVWLLSGAQWTASQVGADTVVTVSGAESGQLVLVGVTLSTLPDAWIFGA